MQAFIISHHTEFHNLKERNHLGELGVDGSTVLKWNLHKQDVKVGLDSTDSG
jgi:hypothetical protein